jgi:hypothetical protein|tara:strand:+ start:201 stop:341 length:141 start_codon:yes stop_codon:yes gene_type:complete
MVIFEEKYCGFGVDRHEESCLRLMSMSSFFFQGALLSYSAAEFKRK